MYLNKINYIFLIIWTEGALNMKPKIPQSLQHGHENLLIEIKELIKSGGKIGEKAKVLNDAMKPHFDKEENFALPPLGLLIALSEGSWEIDKTEAIKMADTLKEKFNEMAQDHKDILKMLDELKVIAEEENNIHAKIFVKNLKVHAELEDQVLYPATLLIGNYLKNKST